MPHLCIGHQTDSLLSITYACVGFGESVQIAFLVAALNGLELKGADVLGAYLNADCPKKVHIMCRPNFGRYEGKTAVVKKTL